ncbi:MAG: U32 family peptidase [Chlorobium sp.]|uniref:peptidase U32 family protein n=1 Tax=Chlorobium sp. TaxID=1095 RepID=UPI002F4068DF
MHRNTIELISPAGDWTCLRTALQAGADAVYFGAEGYNMRAASRSFTPEELPEVANACREYGAKAYLALNTLIYDNEISGMLETVTAAKSAGIDAVICWDMAVIETCRAEEMPFHISTQASISNYAAVRHFAALGASMIVLARELTIEQITAITESIRRDDLPVKIECFVHGAMCVAVSGRCFMSQDLFGKSANRGECLQPCRRKYSITDTDEKFELELGEDYVMSPEDLCAIEFIDVLVDAGISGFKIEGRNRSPEYVQFTTAAYRRAIDAFFAEENTAEGRKRFRKTAEKFKEDLSRVYNRGFSEGFYFGQPFDAWAKRYGSLGTEKKTYIGIVQKYYPKAEVAEILIHARGLQSGETLSIQGPETGLVLFDDTRFYCNEEPAEQAGKGDLVTLRCDRVRKGDKVYVIEKR